MPGFAALSSPWWLPILYIIVVGHISNLCVTLYLHRSATHEGVKFHPVVEHFMRLWLWLTTGMKTREWVACHRKHHAHSDRDGDPHSPHVEGLAQIVFGGVFFYREAVRDQQLLEKYGRGCPDDWVERHVYSARPVLGLLLMLLLNLFLFGIAWGLVAWSAMAVWIPIFGNVINGIGHAIGYRNFDTKDESRNIVPFGIWIVGEELHNNHHADPRSAKFKAKWYEFDIGWVYIRLLSALRLAKVLYARNVSAREFAEKYYVRAAGAAASAQKRATEVATTAHKRASEAAASAHKRASDAAASAQKRASEAAASAQKRASEAAAKAADAAHTALQPQKPATASE
jgi:stearoyl-CoA desaturase (Delta-9 desaturase)